MSNYFIYQEAPYTCGSCGWSGLGKDLVAGEYFNDLFETDCPSCGGRVGIVDFPTTEEVHAHDGELHPLDLLQVELKEAIRAGKISQEDAERLYSAAVMARYPGNSWDEVLRDVADFNATQYQSTTPGPDETEEAENNLQGLS